MKRNVKIALFIFMVLLQLTIPISMILEHQATLTTGQVFKFKAAPVDPYDPFQGRYLSINIEARQVKVGDPGKYRDGQKVYAILETDDEGYAKISGLSVDAPVNSPYFKTQIANIDPLGTVYLQIPFNRYYMPEAQATAAEKELNGRFGENAPKIYVNVRIYKGNAILESVYISGLLIEDYLKTR